ncbi:MAG: cyclase family protein [Deltaproteobacteria bacterium]|nr:cyclase family protein [Deltaproteobacteria bacterium]
MKLYDITPKIHPGIAVFPGDVTFSRQIAMSWAQGHHLELSSVTTTLHVGAHADSPSHYHRDGCDIAERPLERYLGACEVYAVALPRGERIRPEHLPHPPRAPRVLFYTGSMPDPDVFNLDFNSLSPELVELLVGFGVQLVGIDTPSVDPPDSKLLESHQAIYRHDLAVLEGVVLEGVPPGLYTLIALPLPIVGGDASPVRAVLVDGPIGG